MSHLQCGLGHMVSMEDGMMKLNRIGMGVFGVAAMLAAIVVSPGFVDAAWVVDTNTNIKLYAGPGTWITGGGEFIAKTDQVGDNFQTERFRTFCVQTHDNFYLGETLDIFGISNNSQPDNNPLYARTSALYRAFMTGYALAGTSSVAESFLGTTYTYNQGSQQDAVLLQKAIWKYQQQTEGSENFAVSQTTSNNKFVAAVETLATGLGWATDLLATSLTGSDFAKHGDVKILNLYRTVGNDHQYPAQDQLYWSGTTPQGGPTPIPEPSMMVLLAFGSMGAVWGVRRRNR